MIHREGVFMSLENRLNQALRIHRQGVTHHFVATGGFNNPRLSDGLEVSTKSALPQFKCINHLADTQI